MKLYPPSLTLQETQFGQLLGGFLSSRLPQLQGDFNKRLRFAHEQVEAMAKFDTVLLTSALPQQAYSALSFAKFLRSGPP